MIVEKILGNIDQVDVGGRATDPVLMAREDLARPHQRVTSEAGEVYGISLDEGQQLEPGSVLRMDSQVVCYVELLPEELLAIRPEGTMQWARMAYNIGNMHHAAYIKDDEILTPYDRVLESLIVKLGLAYERRTSRLEGVRAAVSAAHKHHYHSHEDGHGDEEHHHEGHHHE